MGNKGENIGDGGGWSRRFGRTMPHIRSAASGQNPQRPGVRNLGDLARIEGADQRFPYLILQFLGLHSGILKVPVLTLSVCQSLCSLLHCCPPLWPAAESIENVTFDSPMCVWRLKCAVERRGWGERERIQTSRGQRTSPDQHKKAGTEPHPGRRITDYGVVRAIRRTGCCG